MRLLPWSGPEGKPAYLIGDGTGRLSRLADTIENVQLAMADELLLHAADMLADRTSTSAQLRFTLARMTEALTDVCRMARNQREALEAQASGDDIEETEGASTPPKTLLRSELRGASGACEEWADGS